MGTRPDAGHRRTGLTDRGQGASPMRTLMTLGLSGLLVVSLPVEAEAQFGGSGLRSATRSLNRAISNQVRLALRPTLVIRSGPLQALTGLSTGLGGDLIAATASDGSVRLWDTRTGGETGQLRPPLPPRAAAVSGNGALVAVLTEDGAVYTLRRDFEDVFTATTITGATALASLPGGAVLVGTAGGQVVVVDGATPPRPLGTIDAAVTALATGRDGQVLVGGRDGSVHHARPSGDTLHIGTGWHLDGPVEALAFGRDLHVAGSATGTLAGLNPDGEVAWTTALSGPITALSASAVRRAAAVAGGRVVVVDETTGAPTVPLADPIEAPTGVSMTILGRVLVSGAGGRIGVFDGLTGNRLVTMYSTKNSWAALDGSGRYDGTRRSADDVAWDLDGQVLGLKAFAEEWFEPGLAAKYLVGAEAALMTRPPATPDEGFHAPPAVTLELDGDPVNGLQPVRVEATVKGRPAEDETPVLRVERNGKSIDAKLIAAPQVDSGETTRWTWTASVPLASGLNTVRAVAAGWGGIESSSADLTLTMPDSRTASQMVVSGVGINQYADSSLTLNYAVADAEGVVAAFHDSSGLEVSQRVRYLHLNAEAERHELRAHLTQLQDTQPDDVVVLFLSGHARTVGADWYFLPAESVSLTNVEHVREVGVSAVELAEALTRIPAARLVLIIDACQSGAAIGAFENFAQRRAVAGLSRQTGVTVMAATRADQLAPEVEVLGHGIFTYTLLNGLHYNSLGFYNADNAPRDGTVMLGELRDYVEENVPMLAAALEKRMEPQLQRGALADRAPLTPALTDIEADFPVR